MVFYYYYDQLCKAISSSLRITREVIDTYGKIMHFAENRHHIYLQPHSQQGGDRHISYYRMTQEDIQQVIKYQLEIWVENIEKEKEKEKGKGKGKEQKKDTVTEQEKAKEKDQGKAPLNEK